jgi:polyisoprenoid-binding protein YceI
MSTATIETPTAVERWNADRTRTTVEFEVEHLWGLHSVRGRFRSFDGAYILGPGGPELELETTTTVDQGRVAMDEGPLGNIRPPTTVHVKARLVREQPDLESS